MVIIKNRWAIRLSVVVAVTVLSSTWSGVSKSLNRMARPAGVDVLTQHNDTSRTEANLNETILTPKNVKTNFGKLFDLEVDGQIYAQPLIVSRVKFNKEDHTILVVATEHNTLYEFDADTGEKMWSQNYGSPVKVPTAEWGDRLQRPDAGGGNYQYARYR
jgi:outer membrane protein assembly factor BamB